MFLFIKRFYAQTCVMLCCIACLTACKSNLTTTDNQNAAFGQSYQWKNLPPDFPLPVVPQDNPLSDEKIELGRFLFYDKRLSANETQSCASCHHQNKAFTDGLPQAIGSTGEIHPRNSQGLANVVYNPTLTWANLTLTALERQLLLPLFSENPIELGVSDQTKEAVLARIQADANYMARFKKAFPADNSPISWNNIAKSIASFERILISGNSRYDQALRHQIVLTAQEQRGQNLFFGEKAECFHCHGSFNFNDQVVHTNTPFIDKPFHNTGLYNIDGEGGYPFPNTGIIDFTHKPSDMGKFRAPSLRNVALTAPYFHDGSARTLEEVLQAYAAGGRNITSGPYAGDGRRNPFKDDLISTIQLTDNEQQDIIAFLKTLTDEEFINNPRFSNPFPQ